MLDYTYRERLEMAMTRRMIHLDELDAVTHSDPGGRVDDFFDLEVADDIPQRPVEYNGSGISDCNIAMVYDPKAVSCRYCAGREFCGVVSKHLESKTSPLVIGVPVSFYLD